MRLTVLIIKYVSSTVMVLILNSFPHCFDQIKCHIENQKKLIDQKRVEFVQDYPTKNFPSNTQKGHTSIVVTLAIIVFQLIERVNIIVFKFVIN